MCWVHNALVDIPWREKKVNKRVVHSNPVVLSLAYLERPTHKFRIETLLWATPEWLIVHHILVVKGLYFPSLAHRNQWPWRVTIASGGMGNNQTGTDACHDLGATEIPRQKPNSTPVTCWVIPQSVLRMDKMNGSLAGIERIYRITFPNDSAHNHSRVSIDKVAIATLSPQSAPESIHVYYIYRLPPEKETKTPIPPTIRSFQFYWMTSCKVKSPMCK